MSLPTLEIVGRCGGAVVFTVDFRSEGSLCGKRKREGVGKKGRGGGAEWGVRGGGTKGRLPLRTGLFA